jgi:hypothetical protein
VLASLPHWPKRLLPVTKRSPFAERKRECSSPAAICVILDNDSILVGRRMWLAVVGMPSWPH